MYARIRIVGKVGWDDICIIAATVSEIVVECIFSEGVC